MGSRFLRLRGRVEIEKEEWARHVQRRLRRACQATNQAREQGAALKPGLIALIARRYDANLVAGLAFHEAQPAMGKTGKRGRPLRRVGQNLLRRRLTRKQDVLRVLTDPAMPFINNLAGQGARMMKVRQ